MEVVVVNAKQRRGKNIMYYRVTHVVVNAEVWWNVNLRSHLWYEWEKKWGKSEAIRWCVTEEGLNEVCGIRLTSTTMKGKRARGGSRMMKRGKKKGRRKGRARRRGGSAVSTIGCGREGENV